MSSEFELGRQAEARAQALGAAHQRSLDNLREGTAASTRRFFRGGAVAAAKGAAAELVIIPLGVGLVAGLIAYFTEHDTTHVAEIAAGVAFALLLAYAVLLFTVYIVVNYGGQLLVLAIIAGLVIAGLHEIGWIPKFW